MKRIFYDRQRHVHTILSSRDWERFQAMLKARREQVSPFVRRLILEQIGHAEGETESRAPAVAS